MYLPWNRKLFNVFYEIKLFKNLEIMNIKFIHVSMCMYKVKNVNLNFNCSQLINIVKIKYLTLNFNNN